MTDITVKKNDTDVDVAVNMDLTGATAKVWCRPADTATATQLTSSIVSAAAGVIRATTSSLAVGRYVIEVEVTQAARVITFPSSGYRTLVIVPDLG